MNNTQEYGKTIHTMHLFISVHIVCSSTTKRSRSQAQLKNTANLLKKNYP